MASTIRANSALAAGGLALVSHTTSVADDAFVEVSAQFACLNSFASQNLAKFGPDSQWPLAALPSDLAALSLDTGTVYLLDYTSSVQAGILTISAKYVGASLNRVLRTDISFDRRTFGFSRSIPTKSSTGSDGSWQIEFVTQTVAIDYQAETRRVAFAVVGGRFEPRLSASVKILSTTFSPSVIKSAFRISGASVGGYTITQIPSATLEQVGKVKRIVKTVTANLVSQGNDRLSDFLGINQ